MRRNGFGHFQQEPQSIAVTSQVLMMEDVVYRNRNLFANLLEEFYVCLTVGPLLQSSKSHGSQLSQRGGQGNDA